MKPALVILAAGMGSRYGGLKQVDPVGPHGEIVIDYSIYDALAAGFSKLVFIIRKDIEEVFREVIGSKFEDKIEVSYVFQELDMLPEGFKVPEGRTKPWGTAHAIWCARDVVKEPFAAINADDFYGQSAYHEMAAFLSKISDINAPTFSMVGFILKNTLSDYGTVSRGICKVSTDGNLEEVNELTKIARTESGARHEDGEHQVDLTGEEVVSMNFWGFTPLIFPHLEKQFNDFLEKSGQELKSEFYIPVAVDQMVQSGDATMRVLTSQDSWFGVTYPEDKATVVKNIRELIKAGQYPEDLWGV